MSLFILLLANVAIGLLMAVGHHRFVLPFLFSLGQGMVAGILWIRYGYSIGESLTLFIAADFGLWVGYLTALIQISKQTS